MENQKDKQNGAPLNDPISWKSLGFFSAEDYLVYIFKKTEKITAALYLVSGLLKDDEPLKWELRDHGMDLISASFTASSSMPGDKNVVIQSLFTAALETMSLLNVARVSNLISEMNHTLLIKEIDQVVALMRDRLAQNAENAGYVLSESFFKTPSLFSSGFRPDMPSTNKNPHDRNGQDSKPGKDLKEREALIKGQIQPAQKKSQRQEHILALLKERSGLTIKDFSHVITDCSEKTIQRELLVLVDRGVVKKEGERRWSRYSLNH